MKKLIKLASLCFITGLSGQSFAACNTPGVPVNLSVDVNNAPSLALFNPEPCLVTADTNSIAAMSLIIMSAMANNVPVTLVPGQFTGTGRPYIDVQ